MPKVQGSENPTWYVIVITRNCSFLFHLFWLLPWPFFHPPCLIFCNVTKIPRRESPKQIQQEEWTLRACFWKSISCDINTYCKIRKGREKWMAALPCDWKLSRLVLPGRAVAATDYASSHTVLTTQSDSSWCRDFFWITSVLYDGIQLWAFWQVYRVLSIY